MNEDVEEIKCDIVIFSWDEESKYIEEIVLVNIDKSLMVDINKKYEIYLKEVK